VNIFCYLSHFPSAEGEFLDGLTKSVHGLARGIAVAGGNVEILAEGPRSSRRRSRFGYTVRAFPAKRRSSSRSFSVSDELLQFVLALRPRDVLLLNGCFSPRLWTIGRAAARAGLPYIIVPHDPYNSALFAKTAWVKYPYWYLYEKPLLNHALAVQLLDQRHAELLRCRGVVVPTIEIPNGFERSDVDSFTPKSGAPQSDGSAQFYYLGRIDSFNKGLDLLIKAFARFSLGKPVSLTLQGPNAGDVAALKRLAQRCGVVERVHILPPDYERRSPELIAAYDIFCLTSRYEGFGLSALEAMLAERVVLVSSVAGIAPHVTQSKAGLVVEPTEEHILRGLELAWSSQNQWTAMGARGRQYILKVLSWEAIGRTALTAYERLLSQRQATDN
jgi:glycosyltransferase involved in cell wall biosynthesis